MKNGIKIDETSLIKTLLLPLTKHNTINTDGIAHKLADDVASLPEAKNVIISSDSIVEGHHIISGIGYKYYARKLFYRNLSDVACKAAKPLYHTLNLFIGSHTSYNDLKNFCSELKALNKKYGVFLIGGDTSINKAISSKTSAGHNGQVAFIASMTIFAQRTLPHKLYLRGSGTQGGIYLYGKVGGAYLGYLQCIYATKGNNLKALKYAKHYLGSDANIAPIDTLADCGAISSMDISDGLLKDIPSLCKLAKYNLLLNAIPFEAPIAKALSLCNKQTLNFLDSFINNSGNKSNNVLSAVNLGDTRDDFALINSLNDGRCKITQNRLMQFIINAISFGDDYNLAFISTKAVRGKNITKIGIIL